MIPINFWINLELKSLQLLLRKIFWKTVAWCCFANLFHYVWNSGAHWFTGSGTGPQQIT